MNRLYLNFIKFWFAFMTALFLISCNKEYKSIFPIETKNILNNNKAQLKNYKSEVIESILILKEEAISLKANKIKSVKIFEINKHDTTKITIKYYNTDGLKIQEETYKYDTVFSQIYYNYNNSGYPIKKIFNKSDPGTPDVGGISKHFIIYKYDDTNKLIQKEYWTDFGKQDQTFYDYDPLGNLIKIYEETYNKLTTLSWNKNHLIQKIFYESYGNNKLDTSYIETYKFNDEDKIILAENLKSQNERTFYSYDQNGRILMEKTVDLNGSNKQMKKYSYFNNFYLKTDTSFDGNAIKMYEKYDRNNKLILYERWISNILQHRVEFVYENDKVVNTVEFDNWRLDNDTNSYITNYKYDSKGNLIKKIKSHINGNILKYYRAIYNEKNLIQEEIEDEHELYKKLYIYEYF